MILNRRFSIRIIAIFAIFLYTSCLLYANDAILEDGIHPEHITLTWSASPETTQTITWRTDSTVQTGIVEYKEAQSNSYKKVNVLPEDVKTDLGPIHLFSGTIVGLKPGTRYIYRVGDGIHWSDYNDFATENTHLEAFKFLIFGDSQSGNESDPNYNPWHDTVQAAYSANRDAKFFVNVGDLVEIGQSLAHWNNWFSATAGVIDHIPAMPAEGNHETYLPNTNEDSSKPDFWIKQFPLPDNGPQGLKNQVYSFDYGPVHFIILDSQEDEEGPKFGSILNAQKEWLEKDLVASKQPWKIVFFHKTPYYNKASRTNELIKAAFCPIFDQYHVDVVFNGHDHGISRTYFINNDEYVAKPSQGTLYYVTGRSGNKTYPDLSAKVWDAFFFDPQDQPNYIVAVATSNLLTLKAIKADGTVIDCYSIDKAHDTDIPKAIPPSAAWTRYAKPVMAVYGNILSPTMVKHVPMNQDGIWYMDFNAFASYLGYAVTVKDGVTNLLSGDKSYPVPAESLRMDKGVPMISIDALKTMGFSSRLSTKTNILYITK